MKFTKVFKLEDSSNTFGLLSKKTISLHKKNNSLIPSHKHHYVFQLFSHKNTIIVAQSNGESLECVKYDKFDTVGKPVEIKNPIGV